MRDVETQTVSAALLPVGKSGVSRVRTLDKLSWPSHVYVAILVWALIVPVGWTVIGSSTPALAFSFETASIFFATLAFFTAWNTYGYSRSSYLLFIGMTQLTVALLDSFSLISRPVLRLSIELGIRHCMQFWVAARVIHAFSMFLAPRYARLRRPGIRMLAISAFFATALVAAIMWLPGFPELVTADGALTPDMVVTNYLILGVLAVSVIGQTLSDVRDRLVRELMTASLAVAVISQAAFTIAGPGVNYMTTGVGFFGHVAKALSYWLVYEAVVIGGYEHPLARLRDGLKHVRATRRVTLSSIGDGAITTNKDGKVTLLNPEASRITGWAEHDALGVDIDSVFRLSLMGTGSSGARRSRGTALTESVVYAKDASIRYVEYTSSPIHGPDGDELGEVIVFREISERVQKDELIKTSMEKYRALFEHMPNGVSVYRAVDGGKDFVFVEFNRAGELIEGIDAPSVVGRRLSEAFPGLAEMGLMEALQRVWLTGQSERLSPAYCENGPHSGWRENWIYRVPSGEVVAVFQDVTERVQAEQRVEYLTIHDALTGLYNRRYLEQVVSRLDAEAVVPVSVVFGDANGLKLANDAFGHEAGDRLLVNIARVLQACSRSDDIVVRMGGDEFVVIMRDVSEDEAAEAVVRMRRAFDEAPPDPVRISLALGVSTRSTSSVSLREVLADAEKHAYRQKLAESKSARGSLMKSLLRTLAVKTSETEDHVLRMRELALELGRSLGLPDSTLDDLAVLTLIHDIGMVGIPDSILTKVDAPLSHDEQEALKKHPEIGYRVAQASIELAHVADGILSHHENWDGTGYPQGLKGEEIPLIARIVAIVDAYDSMTAGRSYRAARSKKQAVDEIRKLAGTRFDPDLAEAFARVVSGDQGFRFGTVEREQTSAGDGCDDTIGYDTS
ncbi:MAG: HD domain-containing phosphohydrolase [Bacillota bacterium]